MPCSMCMRVGANWLRRSVTPFIGPPAWMVAELLGQKPFWNSVPGMHWLEWSAKDCRGHGLAVWTTSAPRLESRPGSGVRGDLTNRKAFIPIRQVDPALRVAGCGLPVVSARAVNKSVILSGVQRRRRTSPCDGNAFDLARCSSVLCSPVIRCPAMSSPTVTTQRTLQPHLEREQCASWYRKSEVLRRRCTPLRMTDLLTARVLWQPAIGNPQQWNQWMTASYSG